MEPLKIPRGVFLNSLVGYAATVPLISKRSTSTNEGQPAALRHPTTATPRDADTSTVDTPPPTA